MDIVVTGRHLTVSDRFRAHIEEKLEKITQLEPRTRRVEVLVSHEPNRRQAEVCDKVEITCYAKGPVVRAEACVEDKYAALDLAIDKLMERLRREKDRRQVTVDVVRPSRSRVRPRASSRPAEGGAGRVSPTTVDQFVDSPVEVREKVHRSAPMTLSDALSEMELVGHDFYLFHDIDTDRAERRLPPPRLELRGAAPRPRRLTGRCPRAGRGRRCRSRCFLRATSGRHSGQPGRRPATMCPCRLML